MCMSKLEQFDAKAKMVLEAVYELGGTDVETSEISDFTGIEERGIIHYRLDQLEEAGLVSCRKRESEGLMPVKLTSIEDEGAKVVSSMQESEEELTLSERVEMLQESVEEHNRRVERFIGQLDYLDEEGDIERVSEFVEGIEEKQKQLEDELEDMREEVEEAQNDVMETEGVRDAVMNLARVIYVLELRERDGFANWGPEREDLDDGFRTYLRHGFPVKDMGIQNDPGYSSKQKTIRDSKTEVFKELEDAFSYSVGSHWEFDE